ncbi:helix-turn-helix domain-containing protein [Streptomyces coeruleoprunus]|uniref:Helix-turn-helix domain-containing protein n=1 Tax=Streptomyces coeruleoprunus TaxID=285563 RepID=A0ABV9XNU3_9ACTN
MIKGELPPLGPGVAEGGAYEPLRRERADTAEELARLLGLSPERLTTALDQLAGPPAGAGPVAAIRTLIRRRQAELERLWLTVDQLAAVETVTGRRAIGERTGRLLAGAEREVLILDRSPCAGRDVEALLARGVEVRAVLDRSGLTPASRTRALTALAGRGLRVRVAASGVPTRLVAVDRRVTLLPPPDATAPDAHALLTTDPRLRDALVPLFESLWSTATPLESPPAAGRVAARPRYGEPRPPRRAGDPDGGRTPAPYAPGSGAPASGGVEGAGPRGEEERRQRELLALLAAGLKDEAIARRLGVHVHTARRRISRLLDALDARTRFQAGARASQRGWLD